MTLVAGIDSSTSATKVEIRDLETGAIVGHGAAPHTATHPPRSEQDPAAWWAAFETSWQQAGSPHVAAVSVAGQQHGLVALDEAFEVVRPASCGTTRSRPLMRSGSSTRSPMEPLAGPLPVAACPLPASRSPSCRGSAVPNRRRGIGSRTSCCPTTDDRPADRDARHRSRDASGTGYWSPAEGRYRYDLLSIVDADRDWVAMLPEVLGPTERPACGGTRWWRPAPATTWPEPWGVGLSSGDVAVSLGTSGTVYSVADRPATDPSGAVAGFADATSRFLPLVCTLNATKVTEAVRRLLDFDHGVFDELALAAPAGAAGLTLLSVLRWVNVLRTEPTQPAYYRDCGVTSAASNWPGRPWKASSAGCSTVSMRCHASRPPPTADWSSWGRIPVDGVPSSTRRPGWPPRAGTARHRARGRRRLRPSSRGVDRLRAGRRGGSLGPRRRIYDRARTGLRCRAGGPCRLRRPT